MHPHGSRLRGANSIHLAHPDIGFALVSLAPLIALFSLGSRNAYKEFLGHAPQHLSALRKHRQHGLDEKTTPSFVADLSHTADLVPMRQINVGRILHQQHDGRAKGLFPALLKVRLHQCRKGDIWLVKQPIQGFGLFPGVHLSWQRTQRVLPQEAFRLYRSFRSTPIMQLDTPKGSLGPALGIQQVLCVHPLLYHFGRCGYESGLKPLGFTARFDKKRAVAEIDGNVSEMRRISRLHTNFLAGSSRATAGTLSACIACVRGQASCTEYESPSLIAHCPQEAWEASIQMSPHY